MPRLALALRERLVGDVADEVLQEAVLAVLGRARVGLDAEHLLAHQRGEQRLELGLGEPGSAASACSGEGLAEHRGVLEQPALLGGEAVEPGGDQRVQRLGHLERLDLAGRPVDGALLGEQAAVEQHPHRLDRVQRHALARARGSGRAALAGSPGTSPSSSSSIACRRERLEVERGEVALAGAPASAAARAAPAARA